MRIRTSTVPPSAMNALRAHRNWPFLEHIIKKRLPDVQAEEHSSYPPARRTHFGTTHPGNLNPLTIGTIRETRKNRKLGGQITTYLLASSRTPQRRRLTLSVHRNLTICCLNLILSTPLPFMTTVGFDMPAKIWAVADEASCLGQTCFHLRLLRIIPDVWRRRKEN